jgi:hypothetical protein
MSTAHPTVPPESLCPWFCQELDFPHSVELRISVINMSAETVTERKKHGRHEEKEERRGEGKKWRKEKERKDRKTEAAGEKPRVKG